MARPLHILTLSTLFPNAVAPNFGIFVERQTAELASRPDTRVTVINPVGVPPWPLKTLARYQPLAALPDQENWRGLDVHRPRFTLIPKFGGSGNPARIAKAILPLVRALHAAHPFDLIDAEFFYPDGPAAMQLADALGIPFTIKARGADIHHWGQQPGCSEQILAAADQASALLAVSDALRQDMIDLGIAADKIQVHYTGVDGGKFRPVDRAKVKQDLDIAGPLFISTGALIARKNQALVIAAMPQFPEATLLLAGSGEEELAYRRRAESLNVTHQVRFLGNVSHDDLPRFVGAADIAILVSRSEGLANAWVEALSCGTPVIISEAGGARELVKADSSGRIVDQNSDAIAEAIRDLLANPAEPETVRAAVSGFSWQNNGDQLVALFEKLTNR